MKENAIKYLDFKDIVNYLSGHPQRDELLDSLVNAATTHINTVVRSVAMGRSDGEETLREFRSRYIETLHAVGLEVEPNDAFLEGLAGRILNFYLKKDKV